MADLIEEIRERNVKLYGEKVDKEDMPYYFSIIAEKMYSDRTHFVYELLQNAEDACERKRRLTGEEDFKIYFKLSKEGLEVRHNGIIFQETDIRRICDIEAKDVKEEEIIQIGKFGIGFKSVYAYTKSPKIYSGDNSFYIKNLVLPYRVERRNDLENGETLFFIPFNHKEITPERAYKEIKNRLKNLGPRTLLFLRNIKEVYWEIDESSGRYSRESDPKDGYRKVTLYKDDRIYEKWIVFEKPIETENGKRLIEVAYLFGEESDGNIRKIDKAKNSTLVVYFPIEKEKTHLNFLIQAPFNTTATRENILGYDRNSDDWNKDWNKELISKIAEFVAETITKIKSLKLLDVNFLNILPIDSEHFSEEGNLFKPIYDKVKEKLKSDEELLSADDGSYVSAKNALLARGADLRAILSDEQLFLLFNRAKWLDAEITQDKYPLLREYLMNELEVPEIDPERFARAIDKEILEAQPDDWVIKFYKFLLNHKALWRQKTSWQSEGILRSKPIIRLEDGTHVPPFDKDGKAKAYLPATDEKLRKRIEGQFPTVRSAIASDPDANEFLRELGLSEPDAIAGVIEYILPKYRPWNKEWDTEGNEEDVLKISLEENFRDVQWIEKAIEKSSDDARKEEMLDKLKKTEFLYCERASDETDKKYCSPDESIYLGEAYTHSKDIEIFFECNDEIWLLDEMYKEMVEFDTLKSFGCKDHVHVRSRKPGWNGHVVISNWSWNYKRGLNGFDPDAEIEGLEYALNEITFEKSKIIWNLLTKYYKQIQGYVEFSTNQNYNPSSGSYSRDLKYSKMGKLLIENAWLYTEKDSSVPHKPTEIRLSELSEEYDKECPEAKIIAEYLNFKTPIREELKEKLNEEDQELLDLMEEVKIHGLKGEIKNLIKKTKESRENKGTKSAGEIRQELIESLTSSSSNAPDTSDDHTEQFGDLTPDEEEKIQKRYGKELPKILNKLELQRMVKPTVKSETTGGIDMDQFLLEQYGGHCQICNTRLYLGSEKRGKNGVEFVTTHLIETRNKKAYANMEWNVLCLCPNHFTLFKYGINDLKGIWEIAKKVLNGEIAAEWVEERRGNYYIAKIKMIAESGKLEETELYYSPAHIRKLVSLLKESDELQE